MNPNRLRRFDTECVNNSKSKRSEYEIHYFIFMNIDNLPVVKQATKQSTVIIIQLCNIN